MNTRLPLREVAHLNVVLPSDELSMGAQPWIPVSHSELHLACLHFPIAIRLDGKRPALGLILSHHHIKRPIIDTAGKWQGGYKPIAIRCAPFECERVDVDPLSDLMISSSYDHLSTTAGIAIADSQGKPSLLIREIHRLFRLLQEGQEKFSQALDQLLIADVLVPLAAPDVGVGAEGAPLLYVVDGPRFQNASHKILSAMARCHFTAIDIAITCLSSQRFLRDQIRPKESIGLRLPSGEPLWSRNEFLTTGDLDLTLDDGELISLTEIDTLLDQAR